MLLLSVMAFGCTSVQWLASDGELRSLGWAEVTTVPAEGGVITRIKAPGSALGLIPELGGWSLGYRASTIYQSVDAHGAREIIAVGDLAYGVVVGAGHVGVGAEQSFAVLMPSANDSIQQEIHYEIAEPSSEWLRRREVE